MCGEVRLASTTELPAHQTIEVEVVCQHRVHEVDGNMGWFRPQVDVAEGKVMIPEGLFDRIGNGLTRVLVRNDSDQAVELPKGTRVGYDERAVEDDELLADSLEELYESDW